MALMRRTLSAVMFTDVVGYSALVNADEARALKQLESHRRLLRTTARRYGGRVVDTTGDGNLLVLASALRAVECAVALQRDRVQQNSTVAPEQALRLRIGIHQGDIEQSRGRVFGDGVNVGARLEPVSPPGGLAVSAAVFDQIHGELRLAFRPLGPKTLKNIPQPVYVYALDEIAVAAAAARIGPGGGDPRWLWIPAVAALVAVLAVSLWLGISRPPAPASIAVLPLENLSGDGNGDFVEGLHDSLLTEIAKTPHLRVISRTSVMRYAKDKPSIPEIGRALNVANVLEGSVQRSARRIRVNVQLIRAATDEHVWADTFDRDIEDLFDLQTDIAREIARKISGNLALQAMPRSERPTKSVEAYDLYLRAIAQEDHDPGLGQQPPDEPLRLLKQATDIDPEFALAYAARARFGAWGAYWASYRAPDKVRDYADQANADANRAMKLDSVLPESMLAAGLARWWSEGDQPAVEELLRKALAQRPTFSSALFILSGLYDRRGDLPRAIDTVQRVLDVDPNDEKAYEQLVNLLTRERRYTEAKATCEQWRSRSRAPGYVDSLAARIGFYATGDLSVWREVLAHVSADQGAGLEQPIALDRWLLATYEGRYADAAAINRGQADRFVRGQDPDFTWALTVGLALVRGGQPAQARPYLEALVRYLDGAVARDPSAPSYGYLAKALSALGRHREAVDAASKALELSAPKGEAKPSGVHYDLVTVYAQVVARAGRLDEALARLQWLLEQPSDVHAYAVLRDPEWSELRAAPGFQPLIARYRPES